MSRHPVPPTNQISLGQQIVASSTGALLTSLFMTPMDVVKTRLQTQVQPLAKGECFLFNHGLMDQICTACSEPSKDLRCEWFNRPGHFNGTIDAFVKITRNEGIRSLWSGLSPTIVSAIPQTVFYFTLYDNLHTRLRRKYPGGYWAPLVAGAGARSIAATVVSPLEMIRTKMQSEVLSYKDMAKAIKSSIRHEGYTMLWRGLVATLLRDIPFSAVYWIGYEDIKARTIRYLGRKDTNFLISFAAGATSGTIATIFTQPFDVVKTHKQVTLGSVNVKGIKRGKQVLENKPMKMVVKEIIAREGVSGLFTGLIPRIAKTSMACAIMIGTYEYLKLVFNRRNRKEI
ncbi:unnamed protein product [Bursaphelenchus xylophilus]|uniref:(pine wood nematode) hypothetical protein n=1 Tax=Bursaphelenchus xylophilus TaxID=6326 RepID=A0A1I7RU41_BURXY|nr:unnamed protein product [Bursaphelenchus xylophilus]CAG9113798.1 unnamed protein product [Bursaphelenchus xylophilus]